MKIKLNENFKNLEESYLFSEIGQRVRKYKEDNPEKRVISLGIGDVTLPLTEKAVAAMHKAVDEMSKKETFRGYAPEYGYDFLRNAVSDYYKTLGVSIDGEEVFVSDGAKSDVGNIVDILGDNEILIPNPVYPVYRDSNVMSGRKITYINADEDNCFLPMPDGLTEKPYVIYMCSPNNPTGAVYNKEQLKIWVDFAIKTGSLIIFDSAYEAYISGEFPHTVYEVDGARECAIEICSLSKTAGFTGTRCAWTVVPKELNSGYMSLLKLWKRRQATKFNGVPYVIQRAAEAVLTPDGHAEAMECVKYYMENARIISELLDKKGIWYTGGKNSPYIWLKCPDGMDSWKFFDFLLQNAQIVGTPGAGFGTAGEGYFRLTSFGSREDTKEAVERLEKIL